MISELEQDLEACRKADQIIENWKFLYSISNESKRRRLMVEMLETMGFPKDDIYKRLNIL